MTRIPGLTELGGCDEHCDKLWGMDGRSGRSKPMASKRPQALPTRGIKHASGDLQEPSADLATSAPKVAICPATVSKFRCALVE
jgi:hypothetical protein